MWEAFSNIFTSEAFLNNISSILLIIVVLLISVKLGIISIKTKHVQISSKMSESDKERTVIRNQISWVKNNCYAFENRIPKPEGYDVYRGRWLLEKIYDEMINWVIFNHIESTDSYIKIKQQTIWNIVLSNTKKPEHQSDEFKALVYNETDKTIHTLLEIRNEYQ